jgi:hypothetical protein
MRCQSTFMGTQSKTSDGKYCNIGMWEKIFFFDIQYPKLRPSDVVQCPILRTSDVVQ